MSLPTGEQFALELDDTAGTVRATVTELAASLRALTVRGVALVHEYPDDLIPPYGAGIVLVPWPNRVRDGTWTLNGTEQRLDVTEPSTGNATHGLLRNTGYRATDRSSSAVTLAATVFPQHGYPFLLETSVRYELTPTGLQVTHGIRNAGAATAPAAIGTHPYFRVGSVPSDELTVTVSASSWFPVDDRFIPTGREPVEGTDVDLRPGKPLRGASLNAAYSDLQLVDGAYRHVLTAPDGSGTEVWGDEDFAYVQVFTQPAFPGLTGTEFAVALEPMTAPANALQTGEALRWLEPGETWLARWGVRYLPSEA